MAVARTMCLLLSLLASASSLVPSLTPVRTFRQTRVYMADDDTAIIPLNEETIQTSASVSSGAVGLIIGGPVFALIAAVAGNYVVKQESEVAEALRGVGKVSLDVLNFILKVNQKYDLTTKASDATGSAVAKLKESDSEGTISKVETVLSDVSVKVKDLNTEYDLVEKGKQAITYAGDLSVQAIDKGLELNKEYGIADKVAETVKSTVAKGVDAAKKAT